MMKARSKILAGLLMAVMLVTMIVPASAATVADVSYTGNGVTMPFPMAGELTTNVTLEGEGEAQLIVALYDKDGRLVSTKLSNGDLSATLDIPNLDAYTVKTFVWDSAAGEMIPYELPEEKLAIKLNANGYIKRAVLDWKLLNAVPAEGAVYEIYRNGSKIAETTSGGYIDEIEPGTYTYQVKCGNAASNAAEAEVVDYVPAGEEEESGNEFDMYALPGEVEDNAAEGVKDTEVGVTQVTYVSGGSYSILLPAEECTDESVAAVLAENNLSYFDMSLSDGAAKHVTGVEGTDSTTGETVAKNTWYTTRYVRGSEVVGGAAANRHFSPGFINFNLDNFTTSDNKVELKIEYLDVGTANLGLRWCTTGSSSAVNFPRTNTGEWKTITYTISDLDISGTALLSGKADIRVEANGVDTYVSGIWARKPGVVSYTIPGETEHTATGTGDTNVGMYQFYFANAILQPASASTDEEMTQFLSDNNIGYFEPSGSDAGVMHVPNVEDKEGVVKNTWFTTMNARSGKLSDPQRKTSPGFIYFTMENLTVDDTNVDITVEYLDVGTTALGLCWCTDSSNGNTKVTIPRTDTGVWKKHTFNITNLNVTGIALQNGKADFRVEANSVDTYIASVTVKNVTNAAEADPFYANYMPIDSAETAEIRNADELYPEGISITFENGAAVSNGIEVKTNNSDGSYSIVDNYVTTIEHPSTERTSRTMIYLGADHDYLWGAMDPYVAVEITYLDSLAGGTISMHYNTTDTTVKAAVTGDYKGTSAITMTGDNEWKTATFVLPDAGFIGTQNAGADCRIVMGGGDVNNDHLKISKIVMKNMSHREVTGRTAENDKMKIYIASDSIAARWADDHAAGIVGWGMRLPNYLDGSVEVVNYAIAGRSTLNFPNMPAIYEQADANDYVLIGFGHNDSMSDPARHTTVDEYKQNLRNFVANIRQTRATPVILSVIPTYIVSTDLYGVFENSSSADGIEAYRDAAIEVAKELKVPYIDVTEKFRAQLTSLGSTAERAAYYADEGSDRRVHLTDAGATALARIIAEGLLESTEIHALKEHITVTDVPQIFLAADSIGQPLPSNFSDPLQVGFGMVLGNFFNEDVLIYNKAKGGKSTRSFINDIDCTASDVYDGRMAAIDEAAQPGDYLIVCLGINDMQTNTARPLQWTYPDAERVTDDTSYRYNLKQFAKFAEERGMKLVFMTPTYSCTFSDGVLVDSTSSSIGYGEKWGREDYRQAMREVGAELGIPVIELAAKQKELLEAWGSDAASTQFFADGTHPTQVGAEELCKIIAREIAAGSAADDTLAGLAELLDETADTTQGTPAE